MEDFVNKGDYEGRAKIYWKYIYIGNIIFGLKLRSPDFLIEYLWKENMNKINRRGNIKGLVDKAKNREEETSRNSWNIRNRSEKKRKNGTEKVDTGQPR